MHARFTAPLLLVLSWTSIAVAQPAQPVAGATKVKDIVVYRDDTFYSAFPSIIRRPDGELLVAFRRAPELRNFGPAPITHTDPCAQLVIVSSKDNGETWTKEPRLLFAHPRGGLQDPCMVQLDDDSILCTSYGWALIPKSISQHLKHPARADEFVCLGGVLLRSTDGGEKWSEIPLPAPPGEANLGPFNEPLPICNRGAMCQGKDGRLYWVVVREDPKTKIIGTHLMISEDRGTTWAYSCPVASDEKITFNETSIYETPKGDLVAFMRTEDFDHQTAIARSTDGGKSFSKWEPAGFRGHPHHAIRLPDSRVLVVYGYRYAPFGVRARVLNPECTDAATAPEIILRDDGDHGDLGYPWATMISDDRALVVYYFNNEDKTRYIGGTILQITAPTK